MKARLIAFAAFLSLFSACSTRTVFYGIGNEATVPDCRLAFRASPVELQAWVGEPFDVSLVSLLACQPEGDLSWSVIGSLPPWLALSTADQALTGTPTAAYLGTASFSLSVTQGETGAIGDIVIRVGARPHWNQNPIQLGIQNEGQPFTFDLRPLVSDPLSRTIAFSATGLPAWLSLSASGILSGTPALSDVGSYGPITFTATAGGNSADAEGFGSVRRTTPIPPVWSRSPIDLGTQTVGIAFSFDLNPLVSDPLSRPLTLTADNLPAWMTIADGVLSGTPGADDVGPYNGITLTATSSEGDSAITFAFGWVVEPAPVAPEWSTNPIDLGTAVVGSAFRFDLRPLVSDPQSRAITITAQDLPPWLTLADGVLSGTPGADDVGTWIGMEFTATAAGGGSASAQGRILVAAPDEEQPPIVHQLELVFEVKAGTVLTEDLAQPRFVESPSGRPLSFTLNDTAPWVSLSAAGALRLSPGDADEGAHRFGFTVSDGVNSSVGALIVLVTCDDEPSGVQAPIWLVDPIKLTVVENKKLRTSIAADARDPQGLPLVFTKVSGPSWLKISASGKVTAHPHKRHRGVHELTVRVSNGHLTADARLIVAVIEKPKPWGHYKHCYGY